MNSPLRLLRISGQFLRHFRQKVKWFATELVKSGYLARGHNGEAGSPFLVEGLVALQAALLLLPEVEPEAVLHGLHHLPPLLRAVVLLASQVRRYPCLRGTYSLHLNTTTSTFASRSTTSALLTSGRAR